MLTFKQHLESLKQVLGTGPELVPTPNGRNGAMVNEVRGFSKNIKALYFDLLMLDMQIDVSLATVKGVLSAPLPAMYNNANDATGALPVKLEAGIVGQGMDLQAITAATVNMRQKLQTEVLYPLEQWLAAYRTIKKRNKEAEALRLELDRIRRKQLAQDAKVVKLRLEHDKLPDERKGASQGRIDEAEFKLQTYNDQVQRMTARYNTIEAEVNGTLLTLIKDTTVLKQYAAASCFIYQRCFAAAYGAFDLSIPQYTVVSPTPLAVEGASTSAAAEASAGLAVLPAPVTIEATPAGKAARASVAEEGDAIATNPNTPELAPVPVGKAPVSKTSSFQVSVPSWYEKPAAEPGYESSEEDVAVAGKATRMEAPAPVAAF